jgi:hypothetical protein
VRGVFFMFGLLAAGGSAVRNGHGREGMILLFDRG